MENNTYVHEVTKAENVGRIQSLLEGLEFATPGRLDLYIHEKEVRYGIEMLHSGLRKCVDANWDVRCVYARRLDTEANVPSYVWEVCVWTNGVTRHFDLLYDDADQIVNVTIMEAIAHLEKEVKRMHMRDEDGVLDFCRSLIENY